MSRVIIIIIIIMTLFKEDNSVGQVQSSLRSSIKIHTFTIYTSIGYLTSKYEKNNEVHEE